MNKDIYQKFTEARIGMNKRTTLNLPYQLSPICMHSFFLAQNKRYTQFCINRILLMNGCIDSNQPDQRL